MSAPSASTPSASPTPSPQTQTRAETPAPAPPPGFEIDLDISGMTCAACANRVERKLNKLDGVTATVNYATERAHVTAPEGYEAQLLLDTVDKAGYKAHLPAPPPSAAGGDGAAGASESEGKTPAERELTALRQRAIGAAVLSIPVILISMFPALQFTNWQWLALTLTAPVVVWAGWPFHRATWANLKQGDASMDTLISVGTGAAFLWSLYALFLGTAGTPGLTHEFTLSIAPSDGAANIYLEVAAGVIMFVLGGRYFEKRAKARAGDALRAMLDLGAKDVRLLADGTEQLVPAAQLQVGDRFVVRPGEKVATDGVVVEGIEPNINRVGAHQGAAGFHLELANVRVVLEVGFQGCLDIGFNFGLIGSGVGDQGQRRLIGSGPAHHGLSTNIGLDGVDLFDLGQFILEPLGQF